MAHTLIVGMTMSGKTTLAKYLVKGFKKKGIKSAVLDPLCDPSWEADFVTDNADEFLKYAKRERSHMLFVDEGATAIGKYNAPMEWLATTSRHCGHSCYFICHRTTQLSVTLRNQCSRAYLFSVSKNDAALFADEWNESELMNLDRLGVGEFYIVSRFGVLRKGQIDFDKKTVKLVLTTKKG